MLACLLYTIFVKRFFNLEKRNHNMPKASLNRSILKLAIPNIISNITVPLLGLVDMVLMGHQDSIAYIGAIGLGGTIFSDAW